MRATLLWPLAAALGAVDTNPESVERAVREVFADPAYEDALSTRSGTLIEITRWIRSFIPRLIDWLFECARQLHAYSPVLFWTAFVFLCAVLVLLVMHIGWTLSLAFRRLPVPAAAAERERQDRALRSSELFEQARELAKAGRGREALRGLLLAVLALVEERKILRIARSWTNREILARLRVPGHLSGDILELRSTIESVWYGSAPAQPTDFERCEAAALRIAAGLGEGARQEVTV